MLCFANTEEFCAAVDGFRLNDGDLLYIWWTSASLEFLHTTPSGAYARAHVVAADPDAMNPKASESWGVALTSASVDILRSVLHKHKEAGAFEVGFDANVETRGAFIAGYAMFSTGPRDYVPSREVFRAKPPLLGTLRDLSAGSYLVNIKEPLVPRLQALHEFGWRGEGDRVYVLADFTDSRSVGLHVLRKSGYGATGVEYESIRFAVRASRRTRKTVPSSVAAQNPEGWLRLDLTTLLEELENFDQERGVILSISLENPLGVLFKPVSRAPRYLFLMQSRWLPEDVDYALGCREVGARPGLAASSSAPGS